MASIANDKNGRRRIQFVVPDGSRKTIRLGKIDRKGAESICRHVEFLLASMMAGQPIPRETASWLASIGQALREKLEAVGLVEPEKKSNGPLLGEFVSSYLAKQSHIKPASLLAVQQCERNLLVFFGADRSMLTITAGEAEDFRRWLSSDARTRGAVREQSPGLSPATVAKRLQRCSAIFRDALKRKLISENPFEGIKKPKSTNPARQAYVSVEVVNQLIEQSPSAEWRLLLAMSRHLGVRVPSEPFSMTWDCVDWERGRLRIPSPKIAVHGKPFRVVPILPAVRPILRNVSSKPSRDQNSSSRTCINETLLARLSVASGQA